MTTEYDGYKQAHHRHEDASQHYEAERRERAAASAHLGPSKSFLPRGLTRDDHAYLAPKARDWRYKAT